MAKKKMTLEEKLEEAIVKDAPYEVPENWINAKLNSIVKFEKGKKPKILLDDFEDKAIPYVTIKYFQTKVADQYTFATETNRVCNEDDILIVWDGARAGLIGTGVQGALGSTLCNIRFDNLNKKFMYYYFLGKYDLINSNTKGTGIPHVDPTYLDTLVLSIPPLREQQRIVDKIESLFEKLDKAKELIEEARDDFEKRKSAILEKAFRGELTKEWRQNNNIIRSEERSKLGDIVKINPKRDKLTHIDDNKECTFVPMPSVSEITGVVEKPLTEKYSKVKKGYTYFKENDIIFAKITPCMENGKSAIVTNLIDGFGFGSTEFHVIRCNENVLNRFIYHLVRSKFFRDIASQHMTGAVGQRRVPKSFLEEYETILPTLQEQKEIVRILDKLLEEESKIEELTQLEEQIELIKKSILAKAFRGQLGTNCEDDESALELLKEILNT